MNLDGFGPAKERRRWARVAENLPVAWQGDGCFILRNINMGGALVESSERISENTRLQLEFYAPLDCARRTRLYLRVGASVRWIRPIPDAAHQGGGNRYKLGLAFDQMDPRGRAAILEYTSRRLAGKKLRAKPPRRSFFKS